MNRILLLTAILLAGLVGLTAGLPHLQAEEVNGAKVYSQRCGVCHQPRAPAEFSDSAWAVIVHHMHARGYLTMREMAAVREFLLKNNRTAPLWSSLPQEEGAELSGEALVARNGCQGCHVIKGKGGTIGPSLEAVFKRRDAAYILRKLSNPTFDNPRSVMPLFPLSDSHKKAIVEYLRTVQK